MDFDLTKFDLYQVLMTLTDPQQAQERAVVNAYRAWWLTGINPDNTLLQCLQCQGYQVQKLTLALSHLHFSCGCGRQNVIHAPPVVQEIYAGVVRQHTNMGKNFTAEEWAEKAKTRRRTFFNRLTRVIYRDIPTGYANPQKDLFPWVGPACIAEYRQLSRRDKQILLIAEQFAKNPPNYKWIHHKLFEAVVNEPLRTMPLTEAGFRWPMGSFFIPPDLETPSGEPIKVISYTIIPDGYHEVRGKKRGYFAPAPELLIWARDPESQTDYTAEIPLLNASIENAPFSPKSPACPDEQLFIRHLVNLVLSLNQIAQNHGHSIEQEKILFKQPKKKGQGYNRETRTAPMMGTFSNLGGKGKGTGRRMPGHWRGAHPHSYWVGSKEKGQRLETRQIAAYPVHEPEATL